MTRTVREPNVIDYLPGEVIWVASTLHGQPEALRVRFVREARPAYVPKSPESRCLIVSNEHGTEVPCPLKYLFKWREDAVARAEKMIR